MRLSLAAIVIVSLALAGCADKEKLGSFTGGAGSALKAPQYEVKGVTRYDQKWIDATTEGIVVGWNQPRPQKRPPELDAQPRMQKKAAPPKRKSLRKRIKARIWPAKAEPVVPVPPMPSRQPPTVEPEIIVRPVDPVDPVDELLDVPASPTQPMTPARKKPRWWNR